jgi:hypothetical protein
MLGHGDKALSLAAALAFTGIGSGLAVIVTFAFVDAIAVHFGVITGLNGCHRRKGKQARSRNSQGNICGFLCFHRVSLRG